ncbi:unnamed protein product [Lupinus luteus]|uniref:Uncharacterized protein n=1 Tax=Lupinus luteus TaxID=3873 RepID=A0AAV1YG08_LUPLU
MVVMKAWNIQNGLEFTLDGLRGKVLAMVFGNDTLLLEHRGSSDANSPFELVASLNGHTKATICLTVGRMMLFSGFMDNSIKGILALSGMSDAEGKPILFSSSTDNSVRLYELPSWVNLNSPFDLAYFSMQIFRKRTLICKISSLTD